MKIATLNSRPQLETNSKTEKAFTRFSKLIDELRSRELPEEMVEKVNDELEKLNASSDDQLRKEVRKSQNRILRGLERKTKVVPANYYRNLWLALGMSAFGIPFGVALGLSLNNMAYLAIGLPFGMAIGIAIGSQMDKKAKDEGRQLEFDLGK